MPTTLERRDPITAAKLAERAGAALARSAPGGPSELAEVTGRHRSQPARWLAGDRANPFYRFLELVTALSRGPETTPFPLLIEARAIAMREVLAERETGWLICRWRELRHKEIEGKAALEHASHRSDRAEERAARLMLAAIETEMVAIDELLEADRGADPRQGWWQMPADAGSRP